MLIHSWTSEERAVFGYWQCNRFHVVKRNFLYKDRDKNHSKDDHMRHARLSNFMTRSYICRSIWQTRVSHIIVFRMIFITILVENFSWQRVIYYTVKAWKTISSVARSSKSSGVRRSCRLTAERVKYHLSCEHIKSAYHNQISFRKFSAGELSGFRWTCYVTAESLSRDGCCQVMSYYKITFTTKRVS